MSTRQHRRGPVERARDQLDVVGLVVDRQGAGPREQRLAHLRAGLGLRRGRAQVVLGSRDGEGQEEEQERGGEEAHAPSLRAGASPVGHRWRSLEIAGEEEEKRNE